MSETSSQRKVFEPPYSPTRANMNLSNNAYTRQDADSEEEESGEDFDQSGAYISLPGHQPRYEPEPSGPSFPPQVPMLKPQPGVVTSDFLAEDLRHRDIVQNKAVEWIDLMARVPSEPAPSVHTDDSVDDDSLLDIIGQKGLKLFEDAGQPVNNLVNTLYRDSQMLNEIIRDCNNNVAGFLPAIILSAKTLPTADTLTSPVNTIDWRTKSPSHPNGDLLSQGGGTRTPSPGISELSSSPVTCVTETINESGLKVSGCSAGARDRLLPSLIKKIRIEFKE